MFGRIVRWSLLFVFVVLLQTTIVPHITVAQVVKPDLVLITLLVLAMEYGRMGGIWGGFFVGLLLDVYAPGQFGGQALSYTLVGAVIGFFERKKLATEPTLQLLLVVVASLLLNTVYYMAVKGVGVVSTTPYVRAMLTTFLPSSVYTALIAAGVLFVRYYVAPPKSR